MTPNAQLIDYLIPQLLTGNFAFSTFVLKFVQIIVHIDYVSHVNHYNFRFQKKH